MGPDPSAIQGIDPLLLERFVLPLLNQVSLWRQQARSGRRRLPLIALNGPVGAGKSTLGRQLEALAPRFGLRLRVASIDDLYLGWPERGERLAGNPFGVSRVPPGSHDLPLLLEALARWRDGDPLKLPWFDKTLAAGQGDRAGWREQACDALVLEGWLMGCRPLSEACLAALMEAVHRGEAAPAEPVPAAASLPWSHDGAPSLRPEEWRWLPHWNKQLEDYQPLWRACDGLWLLRPLHWALPRRWRFQAEARQRRAGGGWLQPADLERLVRASLCSLPPALYQDPLARELAAELRNGGALFADAGLPASAWGALMEPAASGCMAALPASVDADTAAGLVVRPDGVCQSCAQDVAANELPSSLGSRCSAALSTQAPQPDHQMERTDQGKRPPTQAVAWLDGRRRCRSVWLQPSLSPSSSATG